MTAMTADDGAPGPSFQPSITLDQGQLAALELLVGGWLAPPLALTVPASVGLPLVGHAVALRDAEGVLLAWMDARESAPPTRSSVIPPADQVTLVGPVNVVQPPIHHDHPDLRLTLGEAREMAGATNAIVIATDQPLTTSDRRHVQSIATSGGLPIVLISLVGDVPPDDADAHTLVRAHALTATRWRRDATMPVVHLILPVAGPTDPAGHARLAQVLEGTFAQVLVDPQTAELLAGAEMTAHGRLDGLHGAAEDLALLDDDVAELVARRRATPSTVGLTVFFTGLSGSGKSTVANAVMARLHAETDRRITMLDGDLVRQHLSSELSFSRDHRDLNITRIGFVAAEVTKHGGVAICAPIAPYAATRAEVRRMVEANGVFVLVHVATPLEVCESRDRKGLYAKARAGIIQTFTGISDPYEEPQDAELVLDTSTGSVAEAADKVMSLLQSMGAIASSPAGGLGGGG